MQYPGRSGGNFAASPHTLLYLHAPCGTRALTGGRSPASQPSESFPWRGRSGHATTGDGSPKITRSGTLVGDSWGTAPSRTEPAQRRRGERWKYGRGERI